MINALSVDVEEYYHAMIFQEATAGGPAGHHASRVEASVESVLRLLDLHEVRATFFVLGEVAEAQPAVVRKIAGDGHEIACHGYRHEAVFRRSHDEFRSDVHRAKRLLEDITGTCVLGYRAPSFSIGRADAWAYDVLLEEGYRYDSSSYPILHDRYGDRSAPRFPYRVRHQGRDALIEFPIGTARVLGANLPIGGGGYFRLLPAAFTRSGIQHVNVHEHQPIMFYFHPWELDPDQPRPAMRPAHRFRHYVGMRRQEAKLRRLLTTVRFGTARSVLGLA